VATAAEGFPTTPSVSWRVRAVAFVIGLVLLGLAIHTVVLSVRWVGTTFPGFMVLDNRVVVDRAPGVDGERWDSARR
jgi:hypothetical protein